MVVCKRVCYSGRVQGVGFRFTTRHLAQGYPVAGFVRNLPDGRVEVLAEGEPAQVEAFLAALAEQMSGYVEDREVRQEPAQGLQGFTIRH